jgi:DNA repair exonuclease SbcCD nuclease subunit
MKIWFLADLHFGCRADNEIWLKDYCDYFYKVFIPLLKEKYEEGDIICSLGDVFDNRSSIGINTINAVIDIFEKIVDICPDVRLIVGNHDIYNKSTNDITSLNVLKYIKGVKIYYNPEVEVIGGKTILFHPWIEDKEIQSKLLSKFNGDYIFGHLDVYGVESNAKGIKTKSANAVNMSEFKTAEVYAGHIHLRQNYKNIHYVGNPYCKVRGEGNSKGITVLDIKTGKTVFYENTFSPKFLSENIYEISNLTVADLKKRWNNNYVDLHVLGSDITKCKFDELREELSGYYKEFLIKNENANCGLVNDIGEANSDFEDAKTSEEHLSDFIDLTDWDPSMKDSVRKLLSETREKINL